MANKSLILISFIIIFSIVAVYKTKDHPTNNELKKDPTVSTNKRVQKLESAIGKKQKPRTGKKVTNLFIRSKKSKVEQNSQDSGTAPKEEKPDSKEKESLEKKLERYQHPGYRFKGEKDLLNYLNLSVKHYKEKKDNYPNTLTPDELVNNEPEIVFFDWGYSDGTSPSKKYIPYKKDERYIVKIGDELIFKVKAIDKDTNDIVSYKWWIYEEEEFLGKFDGDEEPGKKHKISTGDTFIVNLDENFFGYRFDDVKRGFDNFLTVIVDVSDGKRPKNYTSVRMSVSLYVSPSWEP